MTALDRPCPETWLAARRAAGKPDEAWADVPGWYYQQIGLPAPAKPHQVSDQGRIRNAGGHVLAQRPNGRPADAPPELQYRLANLCAGGKKVTVAVHAVVLAAFDPEDRDGRDTRHLTGNPAHNWWPEGVTYGTQPENEHDKAPEVRAAAARAARAAQDAAGTARPPRPTFRCPNWARCGGLALNEGSRCAACVARIGKDAAVLLSLRMPLQAVGEFFGYTSGEWVFRLAAEHGGHQGSKAEARTQRPTPWQRVLLVQARHRIKRGMR
jgi:hypothetical protein